MTVTYFFVQALPAEELRQRIACHVAEALAQAGIWGMLPSHFWQLPTNLPSLHRPGPTNKHEETLRVDAVPASALTVEADWGQVEGGLDLAAGF